MEIKVIALTTTQQILISQIDEVPAAVQGEPDCKLVHGQFVKPMLAKAKKETDVISEPIIDIKYDGNMYQIHHSYISEMNAHSTIIFNRKGNVVTNQFPDVVDIVRSMNLPNIILDCEIYPVDMQGNPAEHKLLAKRVHKKNKDEAMQECPVKLAVFDLLSYNANVMLDEPQRNRMTALKEIIEPVHDVLIKPFANDLPTITQKVSSKYK